MRNRAGCGASAAGTRCLAGCARERRGQLVAGLLATVLLAACARSERPAEAQVRPAGGADRKYGVSASQRLYAEGQPIPKGGGSYKLGGPYQVAGRWYFPREEPGYDRAGLASWYGTDFHGRKTANGEVFDMNAITAAHPTLPLPSYAYVTNLENGRTLLVRVNDRGPYAHDRVLDLSRQSARLLGTEARGVARVRVRYAGRAPLDGNDARERQHVAAQPWAADARYAAAPRSGPRSAAAVAPAPAAWTPTSYRAGSGAGGQLPPVAAPRGRHYVQVGLFRDGSNVARLRQDLAALGTVEVTPMPSGGATLYRVRLGPYAQHTEAQDMARRVAMRGASGAQVVQE